MKSNWYIQTPKGKTLGPITEAQCRKALEEREDLTKFLVKQGTSDWRPAHQVLNLFLQLEREGHYIEQDGTIHGPFTEAKFRQMLPTCPPYANWRKGSRGPWNPLQITSAGAVTYPTNPSINSNAQYFAANPATQPQFAQNQTSEPTEEFQISKYKKKIQSCRVLAGIFGILLGGFGIHRFILGDVSGGIKRILLCFLCGVGGMIGLVEGIIYLTKTDDDFIETYQIPRKRKAWF